MVPKENLLILTLVICVTFYDIVGTSIISKRSAEDNNDDGDNNDNNDVEILDLTKAVVDTLFTGLEENDTENVFAEAMRNISHEIDQYLDAVPDEDKKETIEVETIGGYDVETKETVVNGTFGNNDAQLHVKQTNILGKHKPESNKEEDDESDENLEDTD